MLDNPDHGQANPMTLMLQRAFDGLLRQMMVCLPGRVVAFDPDTQRAQVQCGVQKRAPNGEFINIPVIENVPVKFAGDGEWYLWHQIVPGETEGLIHFSQRAVDVWLNQGGDAAPNDLRTFSAEDAFFDPGYRSNPNVIPSFTNEGCGMSSMDGSTRIHMTDGAITLYASGQVVTLDSTGFRHNGQNVGDTHYHNQPNDSRGDTETPTGPPQ